jgi:hypothetical protein
VAVASASDRERAGAPRDKISRGQRCCLRTWMDDPCHDLVCSLDAAVEVGGGVLNRATFSLSKTLFL